MGFFGALTVGGGVFAPPSLKPVTHILQWWNLAQLYLTLWRSRKYINHVTHPWVLLTSAFFNQKSANFATSRNTDIDWISYIISNSFNFLEFLITVLINVVTILMMSAKIATPGLLKIGVFWSKGYDVILFVHDVTNKFFSLDSNCIKDVLMWTKFGYCSISMRQVIITWILKGFDQKNHFFWEVVLVQVQ